MGRQRDDERTHRTQTDASLGSERAATDVSLAHVERQLDELIARDRILTDAWLVRLRRNADEKVTQERAASSAPADSLVDDRIAADESKDAERAAANEALQRERRRDAEPVMTTSELAEHYAENEARRQATNERLSDERDDADAIESALEHARAVERGRSDVFAMVTHDLRNPLAVIVANARSIAKTATDPTTCESAEDMTYAAARMGRLLEDLVDVARIDSGTLPVAKRPHEVGRLLSHMRSSYGSLFDERGVALTVELPTPEVIVSLDYDRIVQLLSNLLGNAMKFTSPGGRVHLWAERDAERVVLGVRDTGAGIAEETVPHLFERFVQDDHDARRGLGLGLYLCRTIAEAHGGTVSLDSKLDEGTTVCVSLPMQ